MTPHPSQPRGQSLFKNPKVLITFLILLTLISVLWILKMNGVFNRYVTQGVVGVYTRDSIPISVSGLISRPLISIGDDGQTEADLITGWQVNNDSTVYTFKLKDNLYWHDGSKVKAEDLKFNLPDVTVTYPNELTIEFKLPEPFSPLPALLTNPVFKRDSLLGVGEYKVKDLKTDRNILTKLVLEPADSKHDLLPVVVVRFYQDEATAFTAFNLGEIDSILGINSLNEVKDQNMVISKSSVIHNKLVAVFYNTEDPILSDENFRKALNLATPMIEGEEGARTSIPPHSWAFNKAVNVPLDDNFKKAKEYLDKVKAGKDSTLTLTTTPSLSLVGEKIIESWKKIGVSVVLRVESGVPQNFQALLTTQLIPTDPDQYLLWHSTQTSTNLSKYNSKRIDKDLEDGRKTSDQKIRQERYLDFQKVLADDTPATFLYFPKNYVVYRKKVESDIDKVLGLLPSSLSF